MKKMLSLGIAAALMAMACAAYAAYPTLVGPTGNGVLPTAAVQPAGQLSAALDFYNLDDDDTGLDNAFPVRVVYGVAPNLEIGAAYIKLEANDEDANTWAINAKYGPIVNLLGFAWSAGLQYASTDIAAAGDDLTTTQLYWVGDRAFVLGEGMPVMNVTVGANWTKEEVGDFDADGIRGFAAVSAGLTPKLTGSLELQTGKGDLDAKPLGAITLRYAFNPTLTGQIGYSNAVFVDGAEDYKPFIGINYTFGGVAAE